MYEFWAKNSFFSHSHFISYALSLCIQEHIYLHQVYVYNVAIYIYKFFLRINIIFWRIVLNLIVIIRASNSKNFIQALVALFYLFIYLLLFVIIIIIPGCFILILYYSKIFRYSPCLWWKPAWNGKFSYFRRKIPYSYTCEHLNISKMQFFRSLEFLVYLMYIKDLCIFMCKQWYP